MSKRFIIETIKAFAILMLGLVVVAAVVNFDVFVLMNYPNWFMPLFAIQLGLMFAPFLACGLMINSEKGE